MTPTTTAPRHAAESDTAGSFQPFTDLRTRAQREAVATHAHSINDLGHTHPVYVGSLEEPGHFHDVMPASLSGLVGERFPDASNDALSPDAFTESEFVAEIERQRAHWNGLIDTMLDATAPGWREERARQQAAAA